MGRGGLRQLLGVSLPPCRRCYPAGGNCRFSQHTTDSTVFDIKQPSRPPELSVSRLLLRSHMLRPGNSLKDVGAYGENEGGWALRGVEQPLNAGAWRFYDPLPSYHLKSSTFGFADGHADRRKWMDKRTLEFIQVNKENPASHSGMETSSPDNEDLRWLIEHFWSKERALR